MVKLGITIPYYKTYDLTVKLLDRLIPQLTDEVEVCLTDDGCNEKRLDVYKDKIKIKHCKTNKGGAFATNEGIRNTNSKYVALIDSDDLISEDYIETLLKAIDEHNEDVIFFDWQDMNTGKIVHRPSNYAPWKAIYKREIMPLFKEGWIYSYDVPFQEDLAKTNYTRCYLDKVLYYYNSNRPGNLTTEKEKLIKERNND